MEKLSEKQKNLLKNIILIASMGVTGGISVICAINTTIVAVSNKFIYGTGVFIAIILMYAFLHSIQGILKKIPSKCVYLWTLLFFVALTYISIKVRNVPVTDYDMVYQAVLNCLNGNPVNWEYLSMWPNNYSLFWLL